MGSSLVFQTSTLVCGVLAFLLQSLSTGMPYWKEDIDVYRNKHVYIGLWQVCIKARGGIGFPYVPLNCEKDYLRPQRVEPPSWFNGVRALMLLSCMGTGVGVLIFVVATILIRSKKTGELCLYWVSIVSVFCGLVCAVIGLSIFAVNREHSIQFRLGDRDHFYAEYWTVISDARTDVRFGWCYMVGWGGVFLTLCTFVCDVITVVVKLIHQEDRQMIGHTELQNLNTIQA